MRFLLSLQRSGMSCLSQELTVGGGGGLTDLSSGYEVMLPLKISKTKFPSLLITFIMTFDGKHKTNSVDFL